MQWRPKPLAAAAVLILAMTAAAVLFFRPAYSSNTMAPDTVLTVNGTPVSLDEFNLFLQNNKAMAASYFQSKYHADYSEGFWNTSYQGEKPIDYVKQRTVDELKKLKVEQLLMKEHGEIRDLDFGQFRKSLEEENRARRAKIERQEQVYGLMQFSPLQYYSYLQSAHYTSLINTLMSDKKYSLPESVYRDYYERQKERYYNKGYLLEGQWLTDNPAADTVTLDLRTMSKEDEAGRSLYNEAVKLSPGERSGPLPYNNGQAQFQLTKKQPLGYSSYDEVRSDVKKLYIHEDIQKQLADRLNTAKVQLHSAVYDAIRLN